MLDRSDGGLGGIGRASERNANADANDLGISGEDSSLATAREFLSRLVSEAVRRFLPAFVLVKHSTSISIDPQLLMLACFVILCLLLF